MLLINPVLPEFHGDCKVNGLEKKINTKWRQPCQASLLLLANLWVQVSSQCLSAIFGTAHHSQNWNPENKANHSSLFPCGYISAQTNPAAGHSSLTYSYPKVTCSLLQPGENCHTL
jgi:hypothetical protein